MMKDKGLSVLCLVGLLAVSAPAIESGRLEGWWRFSEPSGDVSFDSSGNLRDALIDTNSVEWIASAPGGGALWFDSVTNVGDSAVEAIAFVEVPDFADIHVSNGFTVAAWVFVENAEPFSALVLRTADKSGWNDGFGIYLGEMGGLGGFVRSGIDANAVEGGEILSNCWTHVAMSYSGRNLSLYIDGKVAASREFQTEEPADATASLSIGPLAEGRKQSSFVGAIADVRIWSEALTPNQVKSVRSQFLGDSIDPNDDDDSDGIPNGWEVRYGYDPRDGSDAQSDHDGDGLTNLQEFRLGRNPCVKAQNAVPSLIKSCTVVTP
ncbi:MAG: LamG domain-containing protein [Kiritimatiellae bacterium]|nr:LamG domain-containing protein [Kiritimatiellia bacterium]